MLHRSIASLVFAIALLVPGLAAAVVTEIDMTVIEGGAMEESVVIIDSTGKEIGSTRTDRRGVAAPVNLPEGSGNRVRFRDGSTSEPFTVAGPGPTKVQLRRRAGAAVVGGGSAAAASKVAGDERPVQFELEALYQYSETNAQMTANIPAVNTFVSPMRDDRVLFSDNFGGAFRVLGPKLGDIARPFIQVRGVSNFDKDQIIGGEFGEPGVTGEAAAALQQNYGIGVGIGFAVPMVVGPTVITLKPYANYLWEQYTIRVGADESAFGFPNITKTSKDITLGSVEVGGQIDFQPVKELGFYLFAGAGLRIPVCNDKRHVTGMTAGGFEDTGVIKFTTSAVANGGIGWKF